MKPFVKWLCLVIALMLCGCNGPTQAPETSTAPSTTVQVLTPLEQYAQACSTISAADNLILTYTVSEKRQVRGCTYTKSFSGNAAFSQIHSEAMTAAIEETVQFGTYTNILSVFYLENTAYTLFNDCTLSTELSAQSFLQQQIPAILLDDALYEEISLQQGIDSNLIHFRSPIREESWLLPSQEATLVNASGTAELDLEGTLLQTKYHAEYLWNNIPYTYEIAVRVATPEILDLSARIPPQLTPCATLSDLRIPKLLMQVVGDVYTADSISCIAVESIYSQALSLSLLQNNQYTVSGTAGKLSAKMEYQSTLSDYRGDVSVTTQVDSFENGLFTTDTNGGEAVTQDNVTEQAVRQSCEDATLSALFAAKHLSGATLQESDESYRFSFTGNPYFVEDLMFGITQFLQVDLDSRAELSTTEEASGYLVIDPSTGLPLSMGLRLERLHTLDGVPNRLSYQLDHTITLSAGK